jgi:diacylglycerol kinase family enzyme
LSLTIALGQREGNLVVAPHAVLEDGWFDYIQAGPLSRWQVLRHLPTLALGRDLPTDHPTIWQGRCRHVQVRSESPLMVHLDGEFFALPQDDVRELAVTLHPAALRVVT